MKTYRTTGKAGLIAIATIAALSLTVLVFTGTAATNDGSKTANQTAAQILAAGKDKKNQAENKKPEEKPAAADPTKEQLEYAVAKDEILETKIYVGNSGTTIKNPRCINYADLVRATPQYREIKKKKLGPDKASYWLLMSNAGNLARHEVINYAEKHKITMITDRESLVKFLKKQERFKNSSDEELIKWFDVTGEIAANIVKLEQ